MKPYQKVDKETGEIIDAIRYFEGQPLNIRFNGQTGRFSRDGKEDLGQSLTIIPLAWRFFTGSLFGRQKANYAEVFYVDAQRNLCVVLFTNAAAQNLRKFVGDLAYPTAQNNNIQTLTDTVVRIEPAVRIRKSDGQRYHVAEFENCGPADHKAVLAFHSFGLDKKIYRTDTRTPDVSDGIYSATYFTMIGTGVRRVAPADDQERDRIQDSYL